MATAEQKQKLLAVCDDLRNNNPDVTKLSLSHYKYGKIEWEDACNIAGSLETNTLVRKLDLSLVPIFLGLADNRGVTLARLTT
jgi:hypothetical protein